MKFFLSDFSVDMRASNKILSGMYGAALTQVLGYRLIHNLGEVYGRVLWPELLHTKVGGATYSASTLPIYFRPFVVTYCQVPL